MTIPPATGLAAPGWYADPPGTTTMRWWDGERWTEQTHDTAAHAGAAEANAQPYSQPYSMAQPLPAVPQGTPVYNFYIWAIVLLPLLSLPPLFMINIESFAVSSASNPFAQYSDPGYLLLTALGWLSYAATVLLAFFDWRQLRNDGFASPFHWAFAFIPQVLVYVIGRSVVARRRSGRGLAPIWVTIGVVIVSLVVYTVWVINMFAVIFSSLPGAYYY